MAAEQLYKESNYEYKSVYPVVNLSDIIDNSSDGFTQETLDHILSKVNHFHLIYVGSKLATRNQIPKKLRRKGLYATYTWCGEIYTERYNGESSKSSDWVNDRNWQRCAVTAEELSQFIDIRIDERLNWFKLN